MVSQKVAPVENSALGGMMRLLVPSTAPKFLFSPYIALISAFAAQMALLGLIFFLSLFLPERVTIWSRIIPVHVREREERRKKEEEKKPR